MNDDEYAPKTAGEHVSALNATGTNRAAFDKALDNLKASKLSTAEIGQVANRYADTVTKYKSKADAHKDISRAYIRNARFQNKIADD